MAVPVYLLAKALYCRAFSNKIHRGYLRKTAILPIRKLRQMLHQHLLQIPAGMASGTLRHLFRRARHHDLAALIGPF